MKINDAPCRYCNDRQVGCHGHCEPYQEFANERKRYKEKEVIDGILSLKEATIKRLLHGRK